jgi:hypothetical protein
MIFNPVFSCEMPVSYNKIRSDHLSSGKKEELIEYLRVNSVRLEKECPFEAASINVDLLVLLASTHSSKNDIDNLYIKTDQLFKVSYKKIYLGDPIYWDFKKNYNSIKFFRQEYDEAIELQLDLIRLIKKRINSDKKREFYTIHKYHLLSNYIVLSKMYLKVGDCKKYIAQLSDLQEAASLQDYADYNDDILKGISSLKESSKLCVNN